MSWSGSRARPGPDLLTSLDQRLTQAAHVLLPPRSDDLATQGRGTAAATLLPELLAVCTDPARPDARWLVLTAAFGAFPTTQHVKDFGRHLELARPEQAQSELLAQVIRDARRGRADLPMVVVTGGTVVDVDFCARHDTHSGIQRVVRETVPRWGAAHEIHAVAWIDEYSAFRSLAPREQERVFSFGRPTSVDVAAERLFSPELVVPWQSVVVLTDVPRPAASGPLAALATCSGNVLSLIAYDMIPITSAEMRPPSDPAAFAQYLTVVKHAHRVAGISRSATAEFTGFVETLGAQGLAGPDVREVLLAGEPPRTMAGEGRPAVRPVMLLVGSREPHKNQRAGLHAAERLWRKGLDFEVRILGGPGWSDAVLQAAVDSLVQQGRPVTALGLVSDSRLAQEMRSASFVFFASLHEGYGLPVAESLACGTPVITSRFGSQQELAELGGCLTVDPRDDDDVTAAVERLLTEPAELARLRAQARTRPVRTWDTYARELWQFLVGRDAA